MKPATSAAIVVFLLVGLLHLLRVVLQTEVLVGGFLVPQWISVLGSIVPAVLAVGLWRDAHAGSG